MCPHKSWLAENEDNLIQGSNLVQLRASEYTCLKKKLLQ
jgi:hypothetical protein